MKMGEEIWREGKQKMMNQFRNINPPRDGSYVRKGDLSIQAFHIHVS